MPRRTAAPKACRRSLLAHAAPWTGCRDVSPCQSARDVDAHLRDREPARASVATTITITTTTRRPRALLACAGAAVARAHVHVSACEFLLHNSGTALHVCAPVRVKKKKESRRCLGLARATAVGRSAVAAVVVARPTWVIGWWKISVRGTGCRL